MLNIEQPLECMGYSSFEVRNVRPDPGNSDLIIADLYTHGHHEYTFHFYASTGVYCGSETEDNPTRLRPKSAMLPVDRYFIWGGRRDWSKDDWVKVTSINPLETGAEAATVMKHQNGIASDNKSPFRFIVKKETQLSPVRDFDQWAAFRFETGDWFAAPWADEPWVKPEHYAHISKADDSQIAFWASVEDAQRDCVTVMKPGRYLAAYYSDFLTNEEIRDWAVKVDVEADLIFAATEEEIYEAYSAERAPHSCMVYKDGSPNWRYGNSPVRVYAAGDLQLAYLKRRNKIVARCLVWPEQKVAGRAYGDIERIVDRLRAEGYQFDSPRHNAHTDPAGLFNGARILRRAPEGRPKNLILPYLDFGYRVSPIEGDNDYLELDRHGAIAADRTDGLAFEPQYEPDELPTFFVEDVECYHCEEDVPETEISYVNGRSYCDTCYSNNFIECDGCSTDVNNVDVFSLNDRDYCEDYCEDCYNDRTTVCDYCNERHDRNEIRVVYDIRSVAEDGTPGDVEGDACESCVNDLGYDQHGNLIDPQHAHFCDDCDASFPNTVEDCPTCVTQTQEVETA